MGKLHDESHYEILNNMILDKNNARCKKYGITTHSSRGFGDESFYHAHYEKFQHNRSYDREGRILLSDYRYILIDDVKYIIYCVRENSNKYL